MTMQQPLDATTGEKLPRAFHRPGADAGAQGRAPAAHRPSHPVDVCDAMTHGGTWPITSDALGISVPPGYRRFLLPTCDQNYPDTLVPDSLNNANPLGIARLVDGQTTRDALG